MSKKENKEKLTPGGGHEVAEPAVGYGGTMTNTAVRREYDLDRDMTPEELYGIVVDEINAIYEGDEEETMSLEEARAVLHKTVRDAYAEP